MTIALAVIAWALIGVICGAIAPMIAGTYSKDRLGRLCAAGAAVTVALGLLAVLINALINDGPAGSTFYATGGGVLWLITMVVLFTYEKRRGRRRKAG